jgi:hypothetical protein
MQQVIILIISIDAKTSKPFIFQFLGSFARLRKSTFSFVMSVRPSVCLLGTNRLLLVGFLWNHRFDIFFPENLATDFKFYWNPTRITGTLHVDVFTFMTVYCWIILRMRNVSDKICTESQNTYSILSNVFFSFENHAVYEIKSKNMVEPARLRIRIWRRVACWIRKATRQLPCTHTHTHTPKYLVLIFVPLQQLFHERASMLRCAFITCLVFQGHRWRFRFYGIC